MDLHSELLIFLENKYEGDELKSVVSKFFDLSNISIDFMRQIKENFKEANEDEIFFIAQILIKEALFDIEHFKKLEKLKAEIEKLNNI